MFTYLLFMQGSHLGPGNYNFTSFTDEIIGKVTSLRGPYDLFSVDRNKPMKTGHLAAPVCLIYIYRIFHSKSTGCLDLFFEWVAELCYKSYILQCLINSTV